ncbi:MAG TPA: TetR family transcriptional regulator, partial [Acidimicrobiales bacterium]|nr:TetR family transcriptional regulator [Acidimicrobiales bacterium]
MAYELNGRVAQKQRTRDALIAATRQLVAEGAAPTVEAAAEAASISRTTAYRYFSSQRALLAAAHPETATESMLPADAPADVEARVAIVVAEYTAMIAGTEAQQRTLLRLSLEADPVERSQLPLRQGRVIKWLEEALAPLQDDMSAAELHRLAVAIRSATGIEALVWLTDVAGLSRDEAIDLMRWSAGAMLSAAITDHATREGPKRGRAERARR